MGAMDNTSTEGPRRGHPPRHPDTPTSPPEVELYTAREVAGILKLSVEQTRRFMRAGVIPTVNLGRSTRVRSDDLAAYIRGLARTEPGERSA